MNFDAPPADPLAAFDTWFGDASRSDIRYPHAVALATATPSGAPSVRMVLFKGRNGDGFTFFTNLESRKAEELAANPNAALLFYWMPLERQICIEGTVTRLDRAASEAYFASRPRDSQLGAWASAQSRPVESRAALNAAFAAAETRFRGTDVPCPPHWGGFRVDATSVEFWQGGAHRIHDRVRYRRDGDAWHATRLAP